MSHFFVMWKKQFIHIFPRHIFLMILWFKNLGKNRDNSFCVFHNSWGLEWFEELKIVLALFYFFICSLKMKKWCCLGLKYSIILFHSHVCAWDWMQRIALDWLHIPLSMWFSMWLDWASPQHGTFRVSRYFYRVTWLPPDLILRGQKLMT